MSDRIRAPSVGALPADVPPSLRPFLSALKEAVEVRNGQRGDPMEQGVTLRMLATMGNVTVRLPGQGGVPSGAGPILDWGDPNDMTPPPAVTNLQAVGALATIILSWTLPVYSNHAYCEVWRADENDIGQAQQVGMTPGEVYADAVGSNRTCYYWVRAVSQRDVKGAYNAVAGVRGQTGQDPGYLLDVLAGEIGTSQLATALNNRINLIDGPDTLAGSVAARIKAETTARTTADSALSRSISTLQATVGDHTAAIQTEATARAEADGKLFAQYTVKVDVNGRVAGFGLASTANNGVPTSEFAVVADRFYIAAPGQVGKGKMPFVYQATPTTINGIAVPAGVYMDAAFIKVGTITQAMIGLAAIDDARIANLSAAKITAGTLSADRIGANSITAAKIAANTITANQIAANAITASEISAGAVTADKIAAGAVNADKIAAKAVTADKINVGSLAAVSANLGLVTAATVNITNDGGAGYGYIRSYNKWWGDAANGWVLARQNNGDVFFDVRGGNSRIWLSGWGDCGISFPNFSVDNWGNLYARGDIQASSLRAGIVTADHIVARGVSEMAFSSGSEVYFTISYDCIVHWGGTTNGFVQLIRQINGQVIGSAQAGGVVYVGVEGSYTEINTPAAGVNQIGAGSYIVRCRHKSGGVSGTNTFAVWLKR